MEKYTSILRRTRLFAGIEEKELLEKCECLKAKVCDYKKGEFVFRQGEYLNRIMIVVKGSLHIQREDYWGNRSIVHVAEVGEVLGEEYVAPDSGALSHDVVAAEESAVAFFDMRKMLTVCANPCKFHTTVLQNLFFTISEKNRKLVQKLGHMEKRTTREKLVSYLSEEAERQNSPAFTIPFNRQQLADYLAVDRSAMSNELCKMRDDGLLVFDKNRFELL